MDITGKIKTAVSRHGVRQHTFTFTMEEAADGTVNDVLDDFCNGHNVLSIVFSAVKNKLVYFLVYK
ncbi:MAG: hypothetical protein IKR31_03270 [Prevotella sp.]|nr:hypothetical protein [Prevotella sp.]